MRADVRVGPAGWSYEDWRRIVYPATRPAGFHEAEYLARYFPLIEINTSFYRPLRSELSRLWVKKVQEHPRFQFTAKLYKGFTHDRQLDRDEIRLFCDGLAPLADAGRLGCLLMQFPWSFRFNRENRDFLGKLSRAFGHYPLVAEVRHTSWNCDEGLDAFIDSHIGFCNIDQPQLDHCLPPTAHVTSPIGYVRLHGRNYQEWFNFKSDDSDPSQLRNNHARYDYLYNRPQLEKWKTRIDQIADHARTTYVVTNNCAAGKAVVNALQLVEMLSEEPVDVPSELLSHYPELCSISRGTPAQGNLFYMPPPRKVSRSSEASPHRGPLLVKAAGGSR
jgi:uncharacterized protein YecE (DUF72 family)